jgi:Nuclear transport factor 2 (NTF2) domain
MVMDADAGQQQQQQQQQQPPQMQPSPQSVGREFVRQYYTLLNKAPNHLHRFYNNSSSFVHGGLDSSNRDAVMVIGQKQIHNKIVQLNFHDCHAKISQVDSQATLGNGVVVQVTGELSNDGQPMRRFTQTFVLAAQSPKNYYVHNDIFRYQDYYSDDDLDENNVRSTAVEDDENDNQTVGGDQEVAVQTATTGNALNNQQQPQQPQQYYQQPVLNNVNNNNANTATNNGNGPALVSNYGQPPQQQMNGMMNMVEDQQLQQQLSGGSIVNNQPQQV